MKIKGFLYSFIALSLVILAGFCVIKRGLGFPINEERAYLAAASLSLPDGKYGQEKISVTEEADSNEISQPRENAVATQYSSDVFSEDPAVYADEPKLPIKETLYREGDLSYDNFFIKNTTYLDLDVKSYLERPLGFKFDNDNSVQVLIVHTHTSESYLSYDTGYYHESFYPRSSDKEKNMVRVGEEIKKALEQKGIGVVHATEFHDSPEYSGAYYRSYDTIQEYIKKYPDIKVVLDIHRDSISSGEEGGKVKPTFTAGGKKAAQIMIMTGYDPDGSLEFPMWEDNLSFALKIQQKAEEMYPGMTRPLYFGNFVYNMNVNNGSLLIEVGTDANTLSEAVYSGGLLGNVLSEVLQSE